MKNVKKTKRAVSVIVWAAAILMLFWWTAPEQRVSRFVAKNAEVLEESLGTDLSGGYPGGLGIQYYNCWGEDSGHPIGEFCFGPSILHGRQYYGCYYSPDDEPARLSERGGHARAGRRKLLDVHAEGDNRGMTKKIQDRWYYFEAWL